MLHPIAAARRACCHSAGAALIRRAAQALLAALALLTALPAQNLVANPGFEAGNTGFQSDYSYSASGNCCEGQYTVNSAPNTFNLFFQNPPPASPGSVQMMVVNGSTVPNQRVYYTSVPVVAGTTYRLQFAGCTAVAGGPAILQWQVAGTLIGSPLPLPTATRQWLVQGTTWTATTTGTVEVAIRNLNTSAFPNDFLLDDLFVGPCTACWSSYGTGFPGAVGTPTLTPSAPPALGTSIDLRMVSVRAVPEFGLLVLGLQPTSQPTAFGGTLLVAPLTTLAYPVPAAPAPALSVLAIPSDQALLGVGIYGQFAHTDPTAAVGVAFSRGLELRLGN